MKLSNQALNALMLALQKSLFEQSDIVPILKSFEFIRSPETKRWGSATGELEIKNPPSLKLDIYANAGPNSTDSTTSGSD
tara:strand:+ start:273 stop:512 length:240 start_codon:yes stop_codon:yes gene_type:complete